MPSPVLPANGSALRGARRRRVLAATALLVLGVAGVAIGVNVSSGTPAPSFHVTAVPVTASAGILNPACGDHALEFALPTGWFGPSTMSVPVAQVTTTGTTVVAESDPVIATSEILLRAFTDTCRVDAAFGGGGSEMLRVEIGGKPDRGVAITAAAPGPDGGLVLGGTDDDGMIVGILNADGEPDNDFGGTGWVHVGVPEQLTTAQLAEGPPWPTALAEEPSGEILVGNSEGGGCCGTGWLGALSRSGQLIRHFGERGWSRVPYYGLEDSIAQISLDAAGDVDVLTDGSHMGSVDSDVIEFNRNGGLSASFASSRPYSKHALVPSVFSAGLVTQAAGIVLVGTGQPSLVGGPVDPRAGGFVVTLDDEPRPRASTPIRFPSPMLWQTWVATRPGGGYLLIGAPPPGASNSLDSSLLRLIALTSNGRIDAGFGIAGRGSLALPGLDLEAISFDRKGDGSVVTSTGTDESRIEVVELRS